MVFGCSHKGGKHREKNYDFKIPPLNSISFVLRCPSWIRVSSPHLTIPGCPRPYLSLPRCPAGGALVPVTRQILFADLFARWQLPVVLVAQTGLGTISHSLTALESLRARGVTVHGVAFTGPPNDDNMATIGQIGQVRVLGRLPLLPRLDRNSLAQAMAANFRPEDFA